MIIYLFRDTLRAKFGPEAGIFLMIVGVIALTTWMPVARSTIRTHVPATSGKLGV